MTLRGQLANRANACFLCKWIFHDLAVNGKLTSLPHDYLGVPVFPKGGKLLHLKVEKFVIPYTKICCIE